MKDYQGYALGVYDCQGTHNNRSYYRQRGALLGGYYLYFSTTSNNWDISYNEIDHSLRNLRNTRTVSVLPTEGNITTLSHNTISITQ